MNIRTAKTSDAKSIATIYNYYIKNTVITFEEELVGETEMASRIEKISTTYPYLVLEDKNQIIGYAYATQWRVRSAYRYSAKLTIYLQHDLTRKGLGSKLFSSLLEEIRKTDVHILLGGITLPNESSVVLHEKFGFKKSAHLKEIGFKFNQWLDVGYWELRV
jgi:phosphinothricin acetyltransferase